MRRLLILACAAAASAAGRAPAQPAAADALRPVFDGATLAGWRGRPQLDPAVEESWSPEERARKQAEWDADVAKHWRVENGEIVNDGAGVFLTTDESFGDLELALEYRTVAKADSGVYLRGHPQVQIWDTTEAGGKWNLGADKGSGGLWNNKVHERFPLARSDRPFGEWNRLRVMQVGARTWVRLNDVLVVDGVPMENFFDASKPLPPRGPIQLQTHGGEIRWRGLAVREIPPGEAGRILAERDAGAFVPVFDGKSFDGWSGPLDSYEIIDGAIRCRKGAGGTIHTTEMYADFVARVEFRLPPGGNNGLAIRYPGSGDAAYEGFCEVQVLDDPHERYRSIQPWQACGSAYGLIAAHRGHLRPAGAWNFYEVTARGPRLTVELNGTMIVDGDLVAIEKPPSGKEHPGRRRASGHFGFAGHSDPVEFRNVRIRKL